MQGPIKLQTSTNMREFVEIMIENVDLRESNPIDVDGYQMLGEFEDQDNQLEIMEYDTEVKLLTGEL